MMAQILPKFPLQANAKYPWDEWLDGQIWKLVRGEDFTVAIEQFRNHVYSAARARGRWVTTRKDGEALVVQAVKR